MHGEPALYESKDSVPQVKETFPGSFHYWASISAFLYSMATFELSEGGRFLYGVKLKTHICDTIDNCRVRNISQDEVVRTDD